MSKDTRKIRPIDSGTIYDIPAKVTKLGRNIRDGKWGDVTEVLVAVRHREKDGTFRTHAICFGQGEPATLFMMLEVIKRDMLG